MDPRFSPLPKKYQNYSPKEFTFPFYPTVDETMEMVKKKFSEYLEFNELINYSNYKVQGKMYGFLIVKSPEGKIGYLKAFSGEILENKSRKEFVPSLLEHTGYEEFLLKNQKEVSSLNSQIDLMRSNSKIQSLKNSVVHISRELNEKLNLLKERHKQNKIRRNVQRKLSPYDQDLWKKLAQESSKEKLISKNQKMEFQKALYEIENELKFEQDKIILLEKKRIKILQDLQAKKESLTLFQNASGETKSLKEIFENETRDPPPGTGECCAPKLLQYAFKMNYKPLSLLEFWWGPPHNSLIRKHGHIYPACTSRCGPVLDFMLKGLKVTKNPMKINYGLKKDLPIIYEDSHLIIVNKPYGLLSVPGKFVKDSVLTRLEELYPHTKPYLLIHRLDQDTSGLMIFTKDKKTQKLIQKQFIDRTIKKSYLALIEYGELKTNEGEIILPLASDEMNPPFQKVCFHNGKSAITKYKVIESKQDYIKIQFWPVTGRTHQLRVHSAHPLGLGLAIKGDDMYGIKSNRLYLHAHTIKFLHPETNKMMEFSSNPEFL